MNDETPFWQQKNLEQMTQAEWESLCDGCGRCCLHRLEDEDSGEIRPTRVACRLLDTDRCYCTQYARRQHFVPDCIRLTPARARRYHWLPDTCAYRRLATGQDLAWWHPLVSGNPQSVHQAGISVSGHVVSENAVAPEDIQDYPWEQE